MSDKYKGSGLMASNSYDIDFSGMTPGLENLTRGYVDYAKEVIVRRALPELRDGLKPVNRRILYTMYKNKCIGKMTKCADIAGATMKFHAHGDAPIYDALVLMTDKNGTMMLPVIDGQGNFGGVCTTDSPAASRYTEAKLSDIAVAEYFGEMNGIDFVPNFDSSALEPDALPVSFPAVLCNSQTGIAVGFRSNMPSFNFNDVIDLTLEYLRNGECKTVICPDFSTGGYYIRNEKELRKLMQTGTAKIKLRGKVTKTNKEIAVVEFPYGKTIQRIQSQINAMDIQGIREVGDTADFEHGTSLTVDCTSKQRVDEVLLALYKYTDLQCNFVADMMTIHNGVPVRYGVWGIIEEWVAWRREVLLKQYNRELEALKVKIRESRAFIELISDKDKLDEVTRLILKVGDAEAIAYILANYNNEIIDADLAKWIVSRRINAFRNGGKYQKEYEDYTNSIKYYEYYIENIDSAIIDQLTKLKSKYGSLHPRRTEITNEDYDFKVTEKGEVIKDDTECLYSFKSGFLKKQRSQFARMVEDNSVEYQFTASASDTLIAIDNRGRVLRIYCEDIPYSGATDLGTYIPMYCELTETDDYKIVYIGVLDGNTRMILYKDGNVGFLDTSEWLGLSRRVRVQEKGICLDCANIIGAVLEEIPDWLCVLDTSGRLSMTDTNAIKRKARTAKTRVFSLKPGETLSSYACLTDAEMYTTVKDVDYFYAPKLSYLRDSSDWVSDNKPFYAMF